MTTLAERLQAWRATTGLSQSEAAEAVGVKFATWIQWERGRRTPDTWKERELVKKLGEVAARVRAGAGEAVNEKGNE